MAPPSTLGRAGGAPTAPNPSLQRTPAAVSVSGRAAVSIGSRSCAASAVTCRSCVLRAVAAGPSDAPCAGPASCRRSRRVACRAIGGHGVACRVGRAGGSCVLGAVATGSCPGPPVVPRSRGRGVAGLTRRCSGPGPARRTGSCDRSLGGAGPLSHSWKSFPPLPMKMIAMLLEDGEPGLESQFVGTQTVQVA